MITHFIAIQSFSFILVFGQTGNTRVLTWRTAYTKSIQAFNNKNTNIHHTWGGGRLSHLRCLYLKLIRERTLLVPRYIKRGLSPLFALASALGKRITPHVEIAELLLIHSTVHIKN